MTVSSIEMEKRNVTKTLKAAVVCCCERMLQTDVPAKVTSVFAITAEVRSSLGQDDASEQELTIAQSKSWETAALNVR